MSKITGIEQHIKTVLKLSIPAILAEISSVVMQYIDAAMVGSLGANQTASIGLVSTSTWLVGGLCIGAATGFSVQVAQFIGAKKKDDAANVLRQSIICCMILSILIALAGSIISFELPLWLGGEKAIRRDATMYFLIYSLSMPAVQFRYLGGSMLQCSGDMKTPSILNAVMCGLDVIFNAVLIFPTRQISLGKLSLKCYGAGLGVEGAALGTALSELIIAIIMMWYLCTRSKNMQLSPKGSWKIQSKCMKNAAYIALPMTFEHTVMCGAQVMSTHIIAPLGTASVAANSLAVTAESFCYMPGYGIASAATTLVGQSIGAGKKEQARHYARLSLALGVVIMSFLAVFMFLFAPQIMAMLTPDKGVQKLGTTVLRIEAFAEPLYATSIVVTGALRGAGDTLVPSILNLISMWGIRILLAFILAPHFGLTGVWIAMCVELCARGVLFLIRLLREKWLEKRVIV